MLINSNIIVTAVNTSFSLWKNKLFPTLFPFLLFSNLLINYGFIEIISEIFKPFMNKFFKVSGKSSFIFFMSMISGIPSNAKYIELLLNKNLISTSEANKILMYTHFNNPLFIIFTIGTLLHSIKLGIIILISHYLGNFIIGLLVRNINKTNINEEISLKNIKKSLDNHISFGKTLKNGILDSINTMLLILGVITFFMIITSIINVFFNFHENTKALLCGIFEITQGLNFISKLNIDTIIKGFLMTIIISFGGFSAHIQVMSLLEEKKIRYKPYLLSRVLHSIISAAIYFILIKFNTF